VLLLYYYVALSADSAFLALVNLCHILDYINNYKRGLMARK